MEKTRRAIKLGQAVCILLYSEARSLVLPDCVMFLKTNVFYRIKNFHTEQTEFFLHRASKSIANDFP